ncbi:hypothetical protein GQ42DRAFT_166118 [Ramicandelaber brevisporus]|nr:hypothetical protein GQ42DRAFT_166118 [Ramicandelaber brevisporus]
MKAAVLVCVLSALFALASGSPTANARKSLPSSAFVPNAYLSTSNKGSSQFGMRTTDNGAGFNQNGYGPSGGDKGLPPLPKGTR